MIRPILTGMALSLLATAALVLLCVLVYHLRTALLWGLVGALAAVWVVACRDVGRMLRERKSE